MLSIKSWLRSSFSSFSTAAKHFGPSASNTASKALGLYAGSVRLDDFTNKIQSWIRAALKETGDGKFFLA